MTTLYGFEREFFVVNEAGEPLLVDSGWLLPKDDCGWLVEARGEPADTPTKAAFNLLAEEHRIAKRVEDLRSINTKIKLVAEPVMKITKSMRLKAARGTVKRRLRYQNFYGHEHHRTKGDERGAGIHFSVTKSQSFTGLNNTKQTININFDWPQLFTLLDNEFKDEIIAAKRKPGFYELKDDGRVEWRSLPNNIPPQQVADRIEKIIRKVSF